MTSYYCWFQNISKKDHFKILEKASTFNELDSAYDEANREFFVMINQCQLLNNNVDEIIDDLEIITKRTIDCHINICEDYNNSEISVIQKNGFKTVSKVTGPENQFPG